MNKEEKTKMSKPIFGDQAAINKRREAQRLAAIEYHLQCLSGLTANPENINPKVMGYNPDAVLKRESWHTSLERCVDYFLHKYIY